MLRFSQKKKPGSTTLFRPTSPSRQNVGKNRKILLLTVIAACIIFFLYLLVYQKRLNLSQLINKQTDQISFNTELNPAKNNNQNQKSARIPVKFSQQDEQIRKICKKYATADGYIVLSSANYFFVQQGFVDNWVYHMRKTGNNNFFIVAHDYEAHKYMQDHAIPSAYYEANLPKGYIGGPGDIQLMQKYWASFVVADLGYHQVNTEIDVVWVYDPIKYMRQHQDVDIMIQSDTQHTTTDDDGFEQKFESKLSPGMLLMRKSCRDFILAWHNQIKENKEKKNGPTWDQTVMNSLAREGEHNPLPGRMWNMFYTRGGPLKTVILNAATFADGNTYSVQKIAKKRGLDIMALHMAYTPSKLAKKHRLREEQLWNDNEEYFNPKGYDGYITFKLQVPDQILNNSIPRHPDTGFRNFKGHFELVHYQMQQVRVAMSLALLFNRVLVFDQFWSSADQFWYPHNGIPFEMYNMTLPFKAPLDHVMDIVKLYDKGLKKEEFGPNIEIREHNFLNNPRMPREIRNNKMNIHVCQMKKCNVRDTQKHLTLKPHQTESMIKESMEPYKNISVWHFKDLRGDFFQGFQDQDLQQKFFKRMAIVSGEFCCARSQPKQLQPSKAYYDMLFDIIPHVDKFGREFQGEWTLLNDRMKQQEVIDLYKRENQTGYEVPFDD